MNPIAAILYFLGLGYLRKKRDEREAVKRNRFREFMHKVWS